MIKYGLFLDYADVWSSECLQSKDWLSSADESLFILLLRAQGML